MNRYVCIKTYLYILPEISAHHLQLKLYGRPWFFRANPTQRVLPYSLINIQNQLGVFMTDRGAHLHYRGVLYSSKTTQRDHCCAQEADPIEIIYIIYLLISIPSYIHVGTSLGSQGILIQKENMCKIIARFHTGLFCLGGERINYVKHTVHGNC